MNHLFQPFVIPPEDCSFDGKWEVRLSSLNSWPTPRPMSVQLHGRIFYLCCVNYQNDGAVRSFEYQQGKDCLLVLA